MELINGKLRFLINVIDIVIAFVLIIISFFIYSRATLIQSPSVINSEYANRLEQLTKTNFTFIFAWYFSLFKTVIVYFVYGIVLLYLRKIVKSIQIGLLFSQDISAKLKKLVIALLVVAVIIFIMSLLIAFINPLETSKKSYAIIASITVGMEVFRNFLLPALIIYCISEVFIYASKIKQENDLTI
jgi:hypothetical protein